MNMTELKNLLTEKNISVKEFSKITKIKSKRLNMILNNQAFFTETELDRVSAFLGVSRNELMHGVTERKGELPEVAEQNNLNHFRFYIKTRLKGTKRLFRLFDVIGGFSFVAIWALYIISLFMGITGLPTILRSADIMLLCFIIPTCGIFFLNDIARPKVIEKRTTPNSKIRIEAAGLSLMLHIFAISAFVNDFIPVESLILTVTGAVALSVLVIISPFKNKPFKNRIVQFIVYMIPSAILIGAEVFAHNYVVAITPEEEGAVGEALATASDMFSMVLSLLVFGVFYFSMVQYYNIFAKGAGKFFIPSKKSKSIGKCKLITTIISYIVVVCVVFLSIWVSQGIFIKYIFTNTLAEHEENVNWTAEFITNFDTQYKKGEYDVVKYEGMKIKIPEEYCFDEKTEYNIIYKVGEDRLIMFQKPIELESGMPDLDLFDEDFGEGKITEEQKEAMKQDFIKYFGFYPETMYEWQKLEGLVTLDDLDIFNPRKTVVMSTALMMKAVASVPDSEYYLYENGDLYARIIIHTIENKEKGNKEMVSISFGSPNLEYSITMAHPDQDNNITIEEVTKILNSINLH